MALEGDRKRYQLLERQMRAAGLTVTQPGPLERWRAAWVRTGICTEENSGRITQNVLSANPLLGVTHGISLARMAPRPDRVPPRVIPPATVQLYIAIAVCDVKMRPITVPCPTIVEDKL